MEDKLVILKYYETIVEAELDVEVLKANEIECTLDADETIVLYPVFDDNEKGIKLYVFEKDQERALQIITEFHTTDNISDSEEEEA